MRLRSIYFVKFFVLVPLLSFASSCIMLDIKGAGVFKDRKYDHKYLAHINVDGGEFIFRYLGDCGGSGFALGIMVPIPVPWYLKNTCQENGFSIGRKLIYPFDTSYQLRYNSTTYDPYIENGSVKFKIPDFSVFKKANDKTLIIHKKKPDGSLSTKELPFDWKIVVEVSGGL